MTAMRMNLRARLRADRSAPMLTRRRLQGWLAALGWPAEEAEDLVLAVSEAVSNSVEHAYPGRTDSGEVELTAFEVRTADGTEDASRVTITVADHGTWRPPAADPGFRGRGLPLIRALTESHEVLGTPTGTTVEMTSRPVRLATSDEPVAVAAPPVEAAPVELPMDGPRPGATAVS